MLLLIFKKWNLIGANDFIFLSLTTAVFPESTATVCHHQWQKLTGFPRHAHYQNYWSLRETVLASASAW